MNNRFSPRAAGGGPRLCAEDDKTFAVHAFLGSRDREARGWEPARGDLVLVSVRVGVKMRAVFVAQGIKRGYGVWAAVIMLGRVRSFPRQVISKYTIAAETVLTPELSRSIRWGFDRPA